MYELIPSKFFLEQVNSLSAKSKNIVFDKLMLVKVNPFRYKRIYGYNLFLFRIRFSDKGKALRIVYFIEGNFVKIVCILDRSKNYKDLKKYLKFDS
ncbi:hypothetical protein HOF78_03130 [Candidatus Woesearchaeota archaeon]|jgi:mRNA-degrading endonuclease RelE of RelBE toxin-antitoxin system|nr:hypothetical protein [Candidatus Woesearchaeota archaeon]MBT6044451.1 hypothetical protein [Candidatus Woesearchaeota archaeon]